MGLVAELKRRKVFKVGAAYLVIAWLAVQAASIGFPAFEAPPWVLRVFILVLLLGFPIALVTAWALEVTPDGVRIESAVAGTKRLVGVAVGLVALALVWYFVGQPADRRERRPDAVPGTSAGAGPTAAQFPAAASPTVTKKSIAVLPFTDLSPGHDQEYFSDGIAEEILNALVRVKDLKVAGRTSSFHFKGKNEDLRTIGQTLGVATILEGSVRKQGNKVRITAQLIQTDDGFHLWSETYDGDLRDVFELQDRIARAIARELQVILRGDQEKRLVPVSTASPEAYALYLQATAIFNRREGSRFGAAIAELKQALELDPRFARAHSRIAALYVLSPAYAPKGTAALTSAAEEHARRAIELDAALAEPHAVLGLAFGQQRRYAEERSAFQRALALDPDDVTANFWLATSLAAEGYGRQSDELLERVLAIDPILPNALHWRGTSCAYAGDVERAERLLRRAADFGLAHVGLGLATVADAHGRKAEAIVELAAGTRVFMADFPAGSPEVLARGVFGDAQARAAALAMFDAYLATRPTVVAGIAPYALLRLGEPARALAIARERPTSNDALLFPLLWSPYGRAARSLPEFDEFARRTGLAELWARHGPPDLCRPARGGDYACDR